MFDYKFLLDSFPVILKALGTTLWVTVLANVAAAAGGLALELLRRTNRPLGVVIRFIIDFIRSTPILVQIYFFYFVLPQYGVTLPALFIGVFSLGLYYASYLAEVFKAGIDAVPRGQTEAAVSLGLSRADTLLRVIMPQMLRQIAAPMGNYFVSLLKATPYLAVIAVPEMLGMALELGSDSFRFAEPMVATEIIFLVLAVAIAQLVRLLELRMLRSAHR
ncbi:ectoine/hydroxyectoine ABC transporter permease subunit EhuD [Bordetella genomosp. 10]|uniref:ectoine/hydroxyectoine ABC transporter permease subunit EhuD n=1 Tax=Bordetella genomosp. 10 TaxID=1416804 RepID=UPI000B9EDA0F|nr:ectoine/hydroxyectoine ABC transporter permease subunit EhuD [Bordetella genomosp. 10]